MRNRPQENRQRYCAYLHSDLWQQIRLRRLAFDGYICQRCGASQNLDVHHLTYQRRGREDIADIITLCRSCHLQHHKQQSQRGRIMQSQQVKMDEFRSFQQQFYALCDMIRSGEFPGKFIVVNVVPGGGKSVLCCIAAHLLIPGKIDKICWASPRVSLGKQAQGTFTDSRWRRILGHRHSAREAGNEIDPTGGSAVYVTTHQTIEADARQKRLHLEEFRRHRYALFIDEGHHLYQGGPREAAFLPLIHAAEKVFIVTGTIEREDKKPITGLPYIPYGRELLVNRSITSTHFYIEYGLGEALKEEAIIPIAFTHVEGSTRYIDQAGEEQVRSELLDDSNAIYTAVHTQIGQALLDDCLKHWDTFRLRSKRSGSQVLVVCANIAQAIKFLQYIKKTHPKVKVDIATSKDEATGRENIEKFRKGELSALVTVAIAYEGLDVPSITHLCCLTHIRGTGWITQMFGRLWRVDYGLVDEGILYNQQKGYAWVPDDMLMQEIIGAIRVTRDRALLDAGRIGSNGGNGGDDDWQRTIPLSSAMTYKRASDIDGEELSPAKYAWYEEKKREANFDGTPLEFFQLHKFFAELSDSDLPSYLPLEPEEPPLATPNEEEQILKELIRAHIAQYEFENELEWGTVNKQLLKLGWKPRDQIKSRQELRQLYLFVVEHFPCQLREE